MIGANYVEANSIVDWVVDLGGMRGMGLAELSLLHVASLAGGTLTYKHCVLNCWIAGGCHIVKLSLVHVASLAGRALVQAL